MSTNEPNFFIIGAQKSGTTSIARYLSEHPQIFIPMNELHYFAFYNQPYPFRMHDNQESQSKVISYETYITHFDPVQNEVAIGEKSPTYLYYEDVPERIHHHIPDARLIAILRNPIDRAFSSYLHAVQRNYEPLDFEAALTAEDERIAQKYDPIYHYQKQGMYTEQISRYHEHFPEANLQVYLYDDLVENPLNMVMNIYEFLGVSTDFTPDVGKQYNVSVKGFKNPLLQLAWNATQGFHEPLKQMLPERLKDVLKGNLESTKAEMPKTARDRLTTLYEPEIRRLEQMIQRDLSHWLK